MTTQEELAQGHVLLRSNGDNDPHSAVVRIGRRVDPHGCEPHVSSKPHVRSSIVWILGMDLGT